MLSSSNEIILKINIDIIIIIIRIIDKIEIKNIDGYIGGNICVLPFRVDENTYLKISKADSPTYYMKGLNLIKVEG